MFSILNLNIAIGKKILLNNINLDIASGKVTAIIGPNGAGKSTLAKALAGLNQTHKKSIFYGGIDINEFSKRELATRRAFLSQKPNNSFPFSVEEIVAMGRYPYYNGTPKQIDHERIEQAINLTEINHLRERKSDTLSGGELQRVHFARVLAQCLDEPKSLKQKLLILDEPANNLDPKHQYELLCLVKKLTQKFGLTTVIIMHDLNHTASFAEEVILLNKGNLIIQGVPREVLTPHTLEEIYEIPFEVTETPNGHLNIQCFKRETKEELIW